MYQNCNREKMPRALKLIGNKTINLL